MSVSRFGFSLALLKNRFPLLVRKTLFRFLLCDFVVDLIDRRKPVTSLGKKGERAAERFYLKQGYWIIERSFASKLGEIDLIASDGRCVIFAEVKTRTSDFAGIPTEAVDEAKQRHITQTARLFAIKNNLENSPIRFDVIAITWPENQPAKIEHFPNAFEATGEFQMF